MTFLRFFDCSGCQRIEYYDCIGTNVIKKNGYIYHNTPPVKCVGCNNNVFTSEFIDNRNRSRQQKIQNTVRVPAGLYLDNLASLTVRGDAVKNMPTQQNNFVNH